MFSAFRRWRRQRTADRRTVPPEQWDAVERTLPFLDFLPPEDRPRLRRMALEFLADKEVHGAEGSSSLTTCSSPSPFKPACRC
jgi:Mlc titration factor MtfA (ptsG expression regulator)